MSRGRVLAVDLGSASTLVWERGVGIVLDEPTVVAVHAPSGRVVAMGDAAGEKVAAGDGEVVLERPLRAGAITDFENTSRLVALLLERFGASRFTRPQVLLCVPTSITDVERRAVEEAVHRAGAGSCQLMEEPLAAAIGAGLPVEDAVGSMIVDIGGGATEVAVLSLGGVVVSKGVRVGGFDLDEVVAASVRDAFDVSIGDRAAESLKIAIGSAFPVGDDQAAEVTGRERGTGRPRSVVVDPELVRRAMEPILVRITGAVLAALADCPPELTEDVVGGGLHLVGGGALLRGLGPRLAHETGLEVTVAADARRAVVKGAGQAVEEHEDLRHLT